MKVLIALFTTVLAVALVACGASPTSPGSAPLNLSGNWIGTGSDAQGDVNFKWALTRPTPT